MSGPFPRAKLPTETLTEYHEAFYAELLNECRITGLEVTFERDADGVGRVVLTDEKYRSPRKQRAAAQAVHAIYQRLSGGQARMAYYPSPPQTPSSTAS